MRHAILKTIRAVSLKTQHIRVDLSKFMAGKP